MSLINDYRSTKQQLAELQARLAQLEGDERLAKEIEFENMLRSVMTEYGKTESDVIKMLDPSYGAEPKSKKETDSAPRRQRTMRIYKNPHTGETVETKGGNHKVLKAWKEEYGAEVVAAWLQES